MKISINKAIRLTKVRRNSYQKCCWCSGQMVEGTYHISIGCQKNMNHYNIWLHIGCAEAFLKGMRKQLPSLQQKAVLEML